MSSPPNNESPDYPCHVDLPVPDDCCVSPCDPPWRKDEQCIYWYETRYFKVPIRTDNQPGAVDTGAFRIYIEFRIIYEHKLCLLGKQHGPLLFTQTLLPGEKVTLYHSDRYRRITSETDRFAVQTTFTQFLSLGTGVVSQQTGRQMGLGQEGNPLMAVHGGRSTRTSTPTTVRWQWTPVETVASTCSLRWKPLARLRCRSRTTVLALADSVTGL